MRRKFFRYYLSLIIYIYIRIDISSRSHAKGGISKGKSKNCSRTGDYSKLIEIFTEIEEKRFGFFLDDVKSNFSLLELNNWIFGQISFMYI